MKDNTQSQQKNRMTRLCINKQVDKYMDRIALKHNAVYFNS